jgi:hypothetical protein
VQWFSDDSGWTDALRQDGHRGWIYLAKIVKIAGTVLRSAEKAIILTWIDHFVIVGPSQFCFEYELNKLLWRLINLAYFAINVCIMIFNASTGNII